MSALHMVHGTNNVIISNIGEIRNFYNIFIIKSFVKIKGNRTRRFINGLAW